MGRGAGNQGCSARRADAGRGAAQGPSAVRSGYLNAGTAEAGIKDISTNRGVLQWSS